MTLLDVRAPLPLLAYARRVPAPPFPLGKESVTLWARARAGVFAGVQALGLAPGDEVLAPAYHHGSEIEALVRAGLVPRFYEATKSLEPDLAELESLLSKRTRALYLIHYLGFPQDAPRWRRFCDERGLLLLEDAAQAWLAARDERPVGSDGDLAVFCLYKTYGLPDGAALLLSTGAVAPPIAARRGLAPLARRHAAWLLGRSELLSAAAAKAGANGSWDASQEFELGAPVAPSAATLFLIPHLSDSAAARRRAHYRLLLDALRAETPPPFDDLPGGASPFAFPVATSDKRAILGHLERAGVRAYDLWSFAHPALPADRFPGAVARRATTIGLPVHQELRVQDVERIEAAVSGQGRARARLRLEWTDDLYAVRREWEALAEQSSNVFATWECAELWWRLHGCGRRLLVGACRRAGGEIIAFLPLFVWRERPFRILRFLAYTVADELGPVCAPPDHAAAASALRRVLAETRSDVLLADRLRASKGLATLVGARVLRRAAFPLIRCDGGWRGFLATRSGHFRKKVAWQERKLASTHDLRFRLTSAPGELDADLDTLFTLHLRRWGGETDFSHCEAFHREFAALALFRGWLRLWFLELDGAPVAAWYGFRFAGREFHIQSGRDPQHSSSAVGSVLLTHTIREALEDGVSEYLFLRGGEPYKYRLATDDPGLETFALARGAPLRAALASGQLVLTAAPVRHALHVGLTRVGVSPSALGD